MDRAQEQMSSGLRVNSLSDDPYAAEQASEISAVLSENDEFIANNDQLISKLTYLDNTLQGLIRTMDTARTLAAQALSGTTTAESRATLLKVPTGCENRCFRSPTRSTTGCSCFPAHAARRGCLCG